MEHRKNCGHINSCGCGDNVISEALPCQTGYPSCDFPEKCSETFLSDCVIYNGDTIVNLDIQKGMRMSEVVQKLINVIVNPGCNYPGSTCLSVIGFQSTKITATTISLSWGAITGSPNYQVEYRLPSSIIWSVNPIVTTTGDTIGNLLPNTTYYVRVSTICGVGNTCYSLTLEIKTKST